MIRAFLFIFIFVQILNADIKYDIFVNSYTKDKEETANKYKKLLEEYLVLNNLSYKVSLNETNEIYTIKIVNFETLKKAKEAHNIIQGDFKNSFIQEREINDLEKLHKEAMNLLKKEKAQEAYESLYKSYTSNQFNNQTLFLLASSAKQNGDIKNSIKFYKLLLIQNPNAHRARLDLASLYYEDNQIENANEQFLIVKSAKIPKNVEKNINNFKIKKNLEKQKNFNLSASLGYISDSNVNLGPTIDNVSLYGVDFTLSDDAKESDDSATSIKVAGEVYNQFNLFTLKSTINANRVDYTKQNDYDTTSYSISTAPMFLNDDALLMFPLSFSNVEIGSSDDYYLRQVAFTPTLKKPLVEFLIYTLKLNLEKKQYKDISQKDGVTYGLAYGLEFVEDKTQTIALNTYFNINNSKDDIYTYKKFGARLSFTNQIYDRLIFLTSINYETTAYDKAEEAFDTRKDEHNLNASANFIYDLNFYNSNLMFSYYKQRNSSNIDLYTYDRSMATIAFNIRY